MAKKKENKGNIFYVYIYLNPINIGKYTYGDYSFDYEPFYVGKGQDNRSDEHISESRNVLNKGIKINKKNFPNINLHKINTILKIIKTEQVPIILKIEENLLEKYSFKLERKCIKVIGRYDLKKGPLTNLTDGGDGTSGSVMSEETKEKLRIIRTGKKASDEAKANMSKAQTGRKHSLETKTKIGDSHRGVKSVNYGKSPSEETIQKMRTSSGKITTIGKYKLTNPKGEIFYTTNGLTEFSDILPPLKRVGF